VKKNQSIPLYVAA